MDLRWKVGIAGLAVVAGVLLASVGPFGDAAPAAHRSSPVGPAARGPLGEIPLASGPSVAPGPSTVDALRATVAPLATTGHNVTMKTVGATTRGSVDAARRTTAVAITQDSSEFDEMVAGGQVYLRINIDPDTNKQLGVSPSRWMRVDPGKMPARNDLPVTMSAADPVGMPGILDGVTSVRRVDADDYAGIIDLTRVTGVNRPDASEVARAGKAARHVPFTLATDPRHRVIEFSVDANGFDPALDLDANFSNYGNPDTVAPPATTSPVPADVYALFTP